MSREIRMVPADWQHPKDRRGNYIPLHDGFTKAAADWDEGQAKWLVGQRWHYGRDCWVPKDDDETGSWSEWSCDRPRKEDYMPDFPKEQRTHLMMYEDCTEGTPISPAFKTPEECARWLADNGASAFGSETASYEAWLATCKRGWSVGLIIQGGKMTTGVEANL